MLHTRYCTKNIFPEFLRFFFLLKITKKSIIFNRGLKYSLSRVPWISRSTQKNISKNFKNREKLIIKICSKNHNFWKKIFWRIILEHIFCGLSEPGPGRALYRVRTFVPWSNWPPTYHCKFHVAIKITDFFAENKIYRIRNTEGLQNKLRVNFFQILDFFLFRKFVIF